MDTSIDPIPEHIKDVGIRLAASLTALDRSEALFALAYARILVELFEEQALPPKWKTPRLRLVKGGGQ